MYERGKTNVGVGTLEATSLIVKEKIIKTRKLKIMNIKKVIREKEEKIKRHERRIERIEERIKGIKQEIEDFKTSPEYYDDMPKAGACCGYA